MQNLYETLAKQLVTEIIPRTEPVTALPGVTVGSAAIGNDAESCNAGLSGVLWQCRGNPYRLQNEVQRVLSLRKYKIGESENLNEFFFSLS